MSSFFRPWTIALFAALAIALVPMSHAEPNPEVQKTLEEIEKTFGHVPAFMRTLPPEGLPGAWEVLRDLELNDRTALSAKTKSLIGLAVASQIPCDYCVYFDRAGARQNGATELEMQEAIAMSALTRQWSTFLNGTRPDLAQFQKEVRTVLDYTAEAKPAPATRPRPIRDAESAYADIEATLGTVPTFFRRFPPEAIAGAWKEFKAIQLNPNTSLSGKDKELIGLAVAAQIPCEYCVWYHTTVAEANGASKAEVHEAVAVAS